MNRDYLPLHRSTLAFMALAAATLALGGQSTLFFLLTVGVCLWSWREAQQGAAPLVSESTALLVCLAALFVTLVRITRWESGMPGLALQRGLPRGAEFLLMVQWVLLCKPKQVRDYVLIGFISVVVLACAALLIPGLRFAPFFLASLVAAMGAMSLAQDLHERLAVVALGGSPAPPPHGRGGAGAFVTARLAGTLALMAPTAMIFVLLPRPVERPQLFAGDMQEVAGMRTIGFSETVSPGDVASVRGSAERVMRVTLPIPPDAPRSWNPAFRVRGMALDYYDGRTWRSSGVTPIYLSGQNLVHMYDDDSPNMTSWRQRSLESRVELEPLDSSVLFAPFAVIQVRGNVGGALRVNTLTDTVTTRQTRRQTIEYAVRSYLPPASAADPPSPGMVMPAEELPFYVQLPDAISDDVRRLASTIAPPSRYGAAVARAGQIESYLRGFAYDLSPGLVEGAEPVHEFLFNRKRGHCEHFAASMVVLLRCLGTPARLVTGFIGGEWVADENEYIFRQSHAHAWVEVFEPGYGWLTFDPTPTAGTEEYASTTPRTAWLNDVRRWLTHTWSRYVVGFDRSMQESLLAGFQDKSEEATVQVQGIAARLWRWLTVASSAAASAEGAPAVTNEGRAWPRVGIAIVLACAGALAALRHWRRVRRATQASLAFYARLLRQLRRRGFRRAAADTPLEFAQHVVNAVGAAAEPVWTITQLFCRARYAGQPLSNAEERTVDALLRRLHQARLTPAKPITARG